MHEGGHLRYVSDEGRAPVKPDDDKRPPGRSPQKG